MKRRSFLNSMVGAALGIAGYCLGVRLPSLDPVAELPEVATKLGPGHYEMMMLGKPGALVKKLVWRDKDPGRDREVAARLIEWEASDQMVIDRIKADLNRQPAPA